MKRNVGKGPFINDVTKNRTFIDPPPHSFTLCHKKEDPLVKMNESFEGFFFNLVPTLLRDCSLCWDHLEVVQTPTLA